MIHLSNFAGQNWTIVPIARPPRLPDPNGPVVTDPLTHGGGPGIGTTTSPAGPDTLPYPSNQLWQLTLAGVVHCDIQGKSEDTWRQETVEFTPDTRPALAWAASMIGSRVRTGVYRDFDLDLWAPHVVTATVYNRNVANDNGTGVDQWRPAPFGAGTDVFGVPRRRLFRGVRADVVVRDTDAIVHRLAYHITLVGRMTLHESVIL